MFFTQFTHGETIIAFFTLNCIVLEKVLKVTSNKGDNKSNNFQKILIQNKKILNTPILHHPLLQERILKKN
jgi:hypothetical protein